MDIQTVSVIVGIFIGLGTMIAGCGFAYAQYKSGGDKYKDNLIDTLKQSVEVEQEKNKRLSDERNELITSHQQQITQLTRDFSELKGRFVEQEKKAQEYKEILQGRDPRQLELLKEIKGFLSELNDKAMTSQTRNSKIDKAARKARSEK